ncbi:MAG: DUF2231 domain-containing protein [Myxococcales bacterium]
MRGELHPFVLHFAVGLLLTAPICDVLGLLLRREPLLFAGRWMTLSGTIAAVASFLTGFGAEASLGPHSAAGEALLHLHRALGIVLVLAWVPIAAWRAFSKLPLPLRARTLYLAAAFTAAAILTVETILGGTLVYRHGVGLSPAARAEPMVPSARAR